MPLFPTCTKGILACTIDEAVRTLQVTPRRVGMSAWRIGLFVLGLAFFVTVAVLDGVMARAASSIKPLLALWTLVPVPLVFLMLEFRPPQRRFLKTLSALYLGISPVLTVAVLFGVGWVGSERAMHPRQCEDLPALADYPALEAQVQKVRFKSRDGTNLSGWLIPGDRKNTVLLLHGYRCNKEEMLPHANMLHRAGYTVLLFDFRSRGESEGNAVTLGYYEKGDALGAIDYLKTRPDVDPARFGVLGVSQGGATAILTAAVSQEIKAVVSEAPFRSVKSVVRQSFTHFVNLPAFPFAPLTVWIAERRLGINSEEVVPEREVAAISPRPVLIMHGLLDRTISPEDGKAVYAAARDPKELWLIPDSAHAQGSKKAPVEYERRIVAFFDTYLR